MSHDANLHFQTTGARATHDRHELLGEARMRAANQTDAHVDHGGCQDWWKGLNVTQSVAIVQGTNVRSQRSLPLLGRSCSICPGVLSCSAPSRISCVITGSLPKRQLSRYGRQRRRRCNFAACRRSLCASARRRWPLCERARLARQIAAWGTSSTASTNGALTIAPVGHSLGWRESMGRVARTRQVVALKSSSRLVLARA